MLSSDPVHQGPSLTDVYKDKASFQSLRQKQQHGAVCSQSQTGSTARSSGDQRVKGRGHMIHKQVWARRKAFKVQGTKGDIWMQSRSGMNEVHFGDSEEARQDETKGRTPVWKPSQQLKITLLLQAAEDPKLCSVIIFPPSSCSLQPSRAWERPQGDHSKVNDQFAADPPQVFQGPDKMWSP